MAHIALSPRGLRPCASVQYMPYIPSARVITITYATCNTDLLYSARIVDKKGNVCCLIILWIIIIIIHNNFYYYRTV